MTTRNVAREESLAAKAGFQREGILAQAIHSPHAFIYQQPRLADSESKLVSGAELARLQSPGASAARLEKILQLLPTAVILLDSRGRVTDSNQAARDLLDGELEHQFWRDIIARNFNPRLDDGHEISLKNGKRVSLVTRSLGDEPGQLIVLNDLTETRELQQQLSRHQRLSAMGRMVSSLAHQIRTPLTAALLYADNMQAGQYAEKESVQRYSGKILSRLQNIERQIRDMLIFARGETELHDQFTVSELGHALKEAAADIQHDNAGALHWQVTGSEQNLLCNADALIGAVLNLIENALHASDSTGEIQVTLSVESGFSQGADQLRIRVDDEGSGVDADFLKKLDTPFVTTKSHGTGLGISIVKLVAQAHRGNFRLLPRAERGMRAEIRLPLGNVQGGQA